MTMKIRTYSELITLPTFEERFEYLKLCGKVGRETFGYDRIFNQQFYSSLEWKRIRDKVIIRDDGCDLGIADRPIAGSFVVIHHLNPIMLEDITSRTNFLLNPEYLITTCHVTHNAIHYGDKNLLIGVSNERCRNDTCPWKQN